MTHINTDAIKAILWKSLPILGLMLLAAWPRLINLSVQGMHGDGDNTYYYNIGIGWASGDYTLEQTCRPVVFFLHGLAIRLLGLTDYAIKYANAACGIFATGLTFVLARLTTRSQVTAIGAGLAVALSPILIEYSRVENAHIVGLPLVLCSAILLAWWNRRKDSHASGLSGLGILLFQEYVLVSPHLPMRTLRSSGQPVFCSLQWRRGFKAISLPIS